MKNAQEIKHYTRIKDLREDMDLTQDEIIKILKLQKTTYCRYEQGKVKIPLEVAEEIARIYNVSLDYIAGLTNKKRSWRE